ncbi:MAG: ABC transporter permease [Bacteroidota bacterium]
MLHQLKFAIRIFLKDKFFSTLNILGLALGIAVSVILLLILQNDLSYDKYHSKYKQIYRLGGHLWATGIDVQQARSARELGDILKEEFPEVQDFVRANDWGRTLISYKTSDGRDKTWYEEDVVRTDSNFFQVFDYRFIAGDPKTSLNNINSIVISERVAKKIFGEESALGKELYINNELNTITGIIENVPENTHLKFDILVSQLVDQRDWTKEPGGIKSEAFWNPDVFTYLLFPPNYDPQQFYAKFPTAIYDKYFKSFGDQVGGHYDPILENLGDIHFHSKLAGDRPQGNLAYLYAFTGIGIFIVLLACINYMNLSTAKSINRAGEIAMKKTLGSSKRALIFSFLGESILLSMIAMVLSIGLVFFVINATSFNSLIGRNLTIDFVGNRLLLLGVFGITLFIGILSGIYPALYLPSIPTLNALKGAFKNRKSSLYLRRSLTTVQFAISIFVVVCTWFMRDQIDFVRSKDLGFDKENVVVLEMRDSAIQNHVNAIRTEFAQNPKVISSTVSYNVMGMGSGGPVMMAETDQGMVQQRFVMVTVGDDYLKTMNIKLLDGRDFNPGDADAGKYFLVNEAAAKQMNWGDKAVGKKLRWFHDTDENKKVIGVVKDFNLTSLHNAVEPLVINRAEKEGGGFLHLKIAGGDLPKTLESIREVWTKYDTTNPYEYFFLDDKFNEQYKEDEVQYKLLSNLSYICIFISLLGLLGLSAFTATQRTKEIGIRKVHGASIPQIIYLLYKDVMVLVLIAAVLVVPLGYYVINGWLGNFAYHAPINFMIFGLVAVLALLFAFITVGFHSLRTARTNPVDSLKYE